MTEDEYKNFAQNKVSEKVKSKRKIGSSNFLPTRNNPLTRVEQPIDSKGGVKHLSTSGPFGAVGVPGSKPKTALGGLFGGLKMKDAGKGVESPFMGAPGGIAALLGAFAPKKVEVLPMNKVGTTLFAALLGGPAKDPHNHSQKNNVKAPALGG